MMGTSRKEIEEWFVNGIAEGKTHMVVLCDTFDWEDYPKYFSSEAEARRCVDTPGPMQKVMEAYWLGGEMSEQLNKRRCFQFGPSLTQEKQT